MNELLLVSRIIYSLANKTNHVKVEARLVHEKLELKVNEIKMLHAYRTYKVHAQLAKQKIVQSIIYINKICPENMYNHLFLYFFFFIKLMRVSSLRSS
jgi:hypothetical protein